MGGNNNNVLTGIELREDAVCVAQVRMEPEGFHVLGVYESSVAGLQDGAAAAGEALRSLVREHRLRIGPAAVALPQSEVLFCNSILPTTDPAELTGMAAFTMEQRSMLPPENLATGHFVLEPNLPGGTRVGLIATPRETVDRALSACRVAGITPRTIISPGLAAAHYFGPLLDEDVQSLVVVRSENPGTCVFVLTPHGLVMSHHEATDPDISEDDADATVRAVRLALESAGGVEPHRIIICGVGHGTPSASELELAFNVPAAVSYGDEHRDNHPDNTGLMQHQIAVGAALEMSPEITTGATLIPSGEGVKSATGTSRLLPAVAGILLFLILAAVFTIGAITVQARRTELRKVTRELDILKPEIRTMRERQELLTAFTSIEDESEDCLDVMRALSRTLPADVFVTNMIFEKGGHVTITAETTRQQKVVEVIAMLERAPMFRDVQLAYSRQTDTADETIVTFEAKAALAIKIK